MSLSTDLRSNESRADKKVTLSMLRPLGHIITSAVASGNHMSPTSIASDILNSYTEFSILLVALNFATMESDLQLETCKVIVCAGVPISRLLTEFRRLFSIVS